MGGGPPALPFSQILVSISFLKSSAATACPAGTLFRRHVWFVSAATWPPECDSAQPPWSSPGGYIVGLHRVHQLRRDKQARRQQRHPADVPNRGCGPLRGVPGGDGATGTEIFFSAAASRGMGRLPVRLQKKIRVGLYSPLVFILPVRPKQRQLPTCWCISCHFYSLLLLYF